jgi:hypothetical protein
LVLALFAQRPVTALPQYSARAARTCDNCHVDPAGWQDPDLLDRQCSLSCSVCHVDPTGGGMRTVAGNYFGIQELSFWGATRRPEADRGPQLFGLFPGRDDNDDFTGPPEPATMPNADALSQPSEATESTPADQGLTAEEEGDLYVPAFGSPLGGTSQWGFTQGRYGGLVADPFILFSMDVRVANFVSGGSYLFFPMQTDISMAIHPVEHLTLVGEGGIQGSQRGAGQPVNGRDVEYFGLHETFIMTHEWPGNSYLKAGRFQPPFGTRLDDHTSPVRRLLGLDPSRPSTYVTGVEVGAAINYPYLNVAAFQLDAGQYGFFNPDHGTAISGVAGWRDLAWGLGGSGYMSASDSEDRQMAGLTWYLNPWRWWPSFPVTYLGEVDVVHLTPFPTRRTVQQIVAFHEIDWRFMVGALLRFHYDYADPDLDIADDHWQRFVLQLDLFPLRWFEIQLAGRFLFPALGDAGGDFMGILRGWY